MSLVVTPFLRRSWAADELVRAFPPARLTERKRAVFELQATRGRAPAGTIECTRWSADALPESFVAGPGDIDVVDGWFEYLPTAAGVHEWHLNFASSLAFGTYTLALFAQDEMQVLEHPALMSVHEALMTEGEAPHTVVRDEPTPVLVRGVERRVAIDTSPAREAGRPRGLYGNEFERAPIHSILDATTVLMPPTVSNILAIEAPVCGEGRYRPDEIEFVLRTAWAGFAAARAASEGPVTIHTGYWGCGAYGGNRVLMTLLQAVAARAAGVERLVIHAGTDNDPAYEGVARSRDVLGPHGEVRLDELVQEVDAMRLEWGESDGN